MKKGKLYTHIVLGALAGFALALRDRDVRKVVQSNYNEWTSGVKKFLKQPTQSIKYSKNTVENWKQQFDEQSDQLLNAVEQVENTLDKFRKDS